MLPNPLTQHGPFFLAAATLNILPVDNSNWFSALNLGQNLTGSLAKEMQRITALEMIAWQWKLDCC